MSHSPRKQTSSSYRRQSKVCARCKKRKTKCDLNFPACTPCKKAGLRCQGYSSSGNEEVPRSLVRSLEDQIARLESQVEKINQSPKNLPILFGTKIARASLSAIVTSPRPFFHTTFSSTLFLHPSCPPLPVARTKNPQSRAKPSSIPAPPRSQTSPTNLSTVPYAAIDQMVRNYTNIHLPQYPCVSESWLHEILARVLKERSGDTDYVLIYGIPPESQLTHFEYFVVFIILAISSLTLTWRAESQAMAASDSFFESALKHLNLMKEVDEIQTLQISLLLAHYAHMNPERVDNWICISNACRVVLDMGLYRSPTATFTHAQAQLRRQLFWVTYGMERSLCGILRLPLSFPEESITVELDSTHYDNVTDEVLKESSANHIYLYRGLETEVHRVLHLQQEVTQLQQRTIDQWMIDINTRLESWCQKAQGFSVHQMLEFRDVQYAHLKAKLHRPTPRLRIRTAEDRQICLEACQILVDDYQKQVKHRRLFYPWHGVHILFEAAVIMLDACWESRDWSPLRQPARFALSVTLPDCLSLLAKVGERWHEAALCADYLRPVVEEVGKAFHDRIMNDAALNAEKEGHTTGKLRQLLFPDGPLAWNARTSEFSSGEFLAGDLNHSGLPPLPDLPDLQWDGNWDLGPG
ncbi:uncharacterized protein LY89DRAFT_586714 [Mollisia scopiformis]|uniref:Zn(2)-C6 fungal-type domain-containing protein n=1 Tax=Mollisia scopiformis TaxID=149040 RepID=A0A194X8A7_MOLSC|nr:uncharacterized protein LY89DRAFT_586714 [Mollisia scopiformis]KUJ16400.1 hypothetical protein LY89DRAFT_586714 [Mollisia scopiformis]